MDPTPFFIDFKDAKKNFSYFFRITCPQAHHLQSNKLIFKFKIKLNLQALFQSAQHIYEKRSPDPIVRSSDPAPDS
jgi:hypothetical protein